MSQITRPPQFVGLETSFLSLQKNYNTAKAVNGGIDFGDSSQTGSTGAAYSGNVNGQWVNVTAPASPNTEFAIPHNLNRVPSWYMFNSDRACRLYQLPTTGTAWTTLNIYLKCDTANAVLRIFIS